MKFWLGKLARFSLRLAFVLGCFVYAAWGIEFERLMAIVGQYKQGPMLGVFVFSLTLYWAGAVRLAYLGRGQITVRQAVAANLLCLGMNNIFPARLGEVAKLSYLKKALGISWAQGLGLVFWERFFDLNMLLFIALISASDIAHSVALYPLIGLCGGVWVALSLFWLYPRQVKTLYELLPSVNFKRHLNELSDLMRRGVNARFFGVLSVYTLGLWTLNLAFYSLAITWVGGVDLNLPQLAIVFVVMALGYNIPTTPGGIGVFEASAVLSLGWFGVHSEEALAISLLIRTIQYLPTIPAALTILAICGLSLKTLHSEQKAPPGPPHS